MAPVISGMPADITTTATSPSGAKVVYDSPTATDLVDGSVVVECQPASGTTFALGETAVSCSASDSSGNSNAKTFKVSVYYDWAGFFSPVNNPEVLNLAKAGSAIAVKFSLGGDMDHGIFYEEANGSTYPRSGTMACDSTDPVDAIEQTVTANSSGLTYDATTDRYTYVWKTNDGWAGTCRLAKNLFISTSTVKKYVHAVISKLGVSDRVQAAVRAVELGLFSEERGGESRRGPFV